MISGVSNSNYSSYIGSAGTSTSAANAKKFQQDLLTKLDTDADGKISGGELKTALANSDSSASGASDGGVLVSLSKDFSHLDSDTDGSLSLDELAAMAPPPMPPQGSAPSTEAVDDLMTAIDSSGDGSISSDELGTALTQAGDTSTDSATLFSALDTNEDGTVSADELAAAMAPPPPPAQSTASELFSALDSDSDGSVSETELSSALSADSDGAASGSSSKGSNASATLASSLTDSTNSRSLEAAALAKMIASLSKQYQLNDTQSVGSQVTTAA